MEEDIVYRQYWGYGRRYCLVDGSNGAMEKRYNLVDDSNGL